MCIRDSGWTDQFQVPRFPARSRDQAVARDWQSQAGAKGAQSRGHQDDGPLCACAERGCCSGAESCPKVPKKVPKYNDEGRIMKAIQKVTDYDLLLEFLVIALDAPAHFGDIDQPTE